MAESKQHWLDRNRPPRVQITYDVEKGNAIEKKEIPFVVGVLSDLSGSSQAPLPKLKDRKFVEVDGDNFNEVMTSIKPEVSALVDNELTGEGKLKVNLVFTTMDDFTPERLVQQIEPLRKLLEARRRLNDLLGKLEGNDELSAILKDVAASTESLKKVHDEIEKPAAG